MDLFYFDETGRKQEECFQRCPSICPHCGTGVKFIPKGGTDNSNGVYYIVECPVCQECCLLFSDEETGILRMVITTSYSKVNIPQNLHNLSPDFCQIYRDTIQARNSGLFSIVGVGLSKAIERLVYDYLVTVQGETPSKNFSQNINKLKGFEDDVIQLSFTRLIRNDEVHPLKETDYTTDDLQEAIDCLVSFFSAKYSTFCLKQKLNPPQN